MRIYNDDLCFHIFYNLVWYDGDGFIIFIFDYIVVWNCDIWHAYF
jgi:hypothetical protein